MEVRFPIGYSLYKKILVVPLLYYNRGQRTIRGTDLFFNVVGTNNFKQTNFLNLTTSCPFYG